MTEPRKMGDTAKYIKRLERKLAEAKDKIAFAEEFGPDLDTFTKNKGAFLHWAQLERDKLEAEKAKLEELLCRNAVSQDHDVCNGCYRKFGDHKNGLHCAECGVCLESISSLCPEENCELGKVVRGKHTICGENCSVTKPEEPHGTDE